MIVNTSTQYPKYKLVDKYHPALHQTASLVTPKEWPVADLTELFREMTKLCELVSGVGLAAPQIGFGVAAVIVRSGKGWIRAINPQIEARIGKQFDSVEGCLTLPFEEYKIRRWTGLKVSYQTPQYKRAFREASGFEATVWQHEHGHLNGHLISEGDRISQTGLIVPK